MNRKWLILLAVGVGTFMSALDSSVANIVLPDVQRSFGCSVAAVEWVITVYLLVVSGLLLSFGRLGDLRGHKAVYISGFGIFVVGSALCGAGRTVSALVASRGFQALGAAMLMANSPAIITTHFGREERGRAMGLQAMMTYLGLTVGPTLGGWLTDAFSWRAVFYINIPVGLLALLLTAKYVPYAPPKPTGERFDVPGAALFSTGLVSALLALNQGHEWGWTSAPVLGLLAFASLCLLVFIRFEAAGGSPMLDLALFRSRLFSASACSAVLNYICTNTIVFLLPFYLIQARGLSTGHAGLVLAAQPVVMAVAAPISGAWSDKVGSRLPGTVGLSILTLGLLALTRVSAQTPVWCVALALVVCGLGTGVFISPNNSALMGSAPRKRQGIAGGVMATARNVGMVLGVGLAGAVFNTVAHGRTGAGLVPGVRAGMAMATMVAAVAILLSAVRGDGAQ